MRELIKIEIQEGKNVVSAKELYLFLRYDKTQWSRWSNKNITNNDFAIKGADYEVFDLRSKTPNSSNGGRPSPDYALTIDFAKKIAMLANTTKGNEVRNYFITCEKRLHKPLSTLDLLELSVKSIRENQQGLEEVKKELKELKASKVTRPDYFTIAGYGSLHGISIGIKQASALGRKVSRVCRKGNHDIEFVHDPRFGKVGSYPKLILDTVLEPIISRKQQTE